MTMTTTVNTAARIEITHETNKLTVCIVQKRRKLKPRLSGHWRVGIQAEFL